MPYTLKTPVHSELLIRKSRFIACVQPIGDRAGAVAVVAALHAQHPGAAHVCWALLAGGQLDFTPADAGHGATVAHELLQQQTGAARLTSLPLREDRGALLLEWDAVPDRRTPALLEAARLVR